MAVLRFPAEDRMFEAEAEVHDQLAQLGIDYERWDLSHLKDDASADEVLAAFAPQIDDMKLRGGYTTADVIDVNPQTPGLDAMLARFEKEHTHSEDEVRFILAGRGIFFLVLDGRVASVEVGPGDLLRVPRGTKHWFTLCKDRRIRTVRFFQDTTGWAAHYTGSEIAQDYQPLCFGPTYLGRRVETEIGKSLEA